MWLITGDCYAGGETFTENLEFFEGTFEEAIEAGDKWLGRQVDADPEEGRYDAVYIYKVEAGIIQSWYRWKSGLNTLEPNSFNSYDDMVKAKLNS